MFPLLLGLLAADLSTYVSRPITSVMDKAEAGPSGDKHDYVSYAPYWWPDPAKPNGLPYIRKDGYRNRELIARGDAARFGAMAEAVEQLAKSPDQAHQENAARRLRVWFLDPATRMNPHLDYGQAVPGRNTGRGAGLIDMRRLIDLTAAVALLEQSGAFTKQDRVQFDTWTRAYLKWLTTSPIGLEEQKAANNHGSWYAAQLIALHLSLGDRDAARRVGAGLEARIAKQIMPTGEQPLETTRQDGYSYSVFNLRALLTAAVMVKPLGVDLLASGAIDRAIAYLKPFERGEQKWPHRQLAPIDRNSLEPVEKLVLRLRQ